MKQRTLRGSLFGLALAAIVAAGVSVSAMPVPPIPDPPTGGCADLGELPEPDHTVRKVTLCHFTASDSNPFVVNEVDQNALSQHHDHHGDCWRLAGQATSCNAP